jgi:hypothetical protein
VITGKKGYLIYVALFCLLAPLAFSDPVISNSTYTTGSSITLNGTTYEVKVSQSNASSGLALVQGNETLGFALGECVEVFDQLMCYVSKQDKNARITLYDQNAELVVTREINENLDVSVGTPILLNISINNTGRTKATDVRLDVTYPIGLKLEELTACKVIGNTIYYEGDVLADGVQECRAVLVPQYGLVGMITTNYSFHTITGLFSDALDDLEVDVETPEWYDIRLTPGTVGIGEHTTLWMNFTANETYNLSIKSVQVPLRENFIFIGSNYINADVKRNILSFGRNIRNNRSFIFEANLTAIRNGTLPLNVSITYETPDPRTFLLTYEVNSTAFPLEVDIDRERRGVLEPGAQEHFRVFVRNTNKGFDVSHYEVTIESNLTGLDTGMKRVDLTDSSTKRVVYDTYYTVPETNESYSGVITVNVIGHDGLMQTLSGADQLVMDVVPLGDVELLKGLNFSTIDGKNVTQVTVFVKSTYGRTIRDMEISDEIPGVFYYKGETNAIIDVPPNQIIEAYSYDLSLGFDYEGSEELEIPTTAKYRYGEKDREAGTTITASTRPIHEFLYPTQESVIEAVDTPVLEEVPESKRTLFILFIIFDILVLVLFVAHFLGLNPVMKIKGFFYLMIVWFKHRRVVSKDKRIQKQITTIAAEEKRVDEEEARIEELIVQLEKEIAKQNKKEPRVVDINTKKAEALDMKYAELEERKEKVEKKIAVMKAKEDEIIKRQEEIKKLKETVTGRITGLKEKKAKLISDITTFKDKLLALHDQLEQMKNKKGIFKTHEEKLHQAQLNVIHSKLAQVETKHEELRKREATLSEKKRTIKKEGSTIQKLLNIRNKQPKEEK